MQPKKSLQENQNFRFVRFIVFGIFALWGEYMNRLDVIGEELRLENEKPAVKKAFQKNGLLQIDAAKIIAGAVVVFTIAICLIILFGFQNPVSLERHIRTAGSYFVGLTIVNAVLAFVYKKPLEVRKDGLNRLDIWLGLESLAISVSASNTFFAACYIFYMLSPWLKNQLGI